MDEERTFLEQQRDEEERMQKHIRLAMIARHVTTQLDCIQEPVCRQMLHALADVGHPLAPTHLATLLQMNQEELRKQLARVSETPCR